MIKEKLCPYCKKVFLFDRNLGQSEDCPTCVDPKTIAGLTYEKDTLFSCLRNFLQSKGVFTDGLERPELIEILKDYPIAWNLFTATTYRTFTLVENIPLQEHFRLGELIIRRGSFYSRRIICLRCNRKSEAGRLKTLWYYCEFVPKLCVTCDSDKWDHPGNSSSTPRGRVGRKTKSQDSMRARAMALNISVWDLRRGKLDPPKILEPGTVVNGLVIIRNFWDETHNRYCPMYLLQCPKCLRYMGVKVKKVEQVFHDCSKTGVHR